MRIAEFRSRLAAAGARVTRSAAPMIGEAPVATWAQTSATTAGWFAGIDVRRAAS